jgi:molecular chaperone GrpE
VGIETPGDSIVTETEPNKVRPNGEAVAAPPDGAETAAEMPDLATVTAERDEYLDQLQRSRAEFLNFRRRTEQERLALRERANEELLRQILPALDDLQRALANVPADQMETPFVQGVQMVERKFLGALERAGVTTLDAKGQPFDPSLHEAVDIVPGTAATTVVDVYQPGYRLGSALLRPAVVRVGDGAADAAPAAGTDRGTDQGK